jgi:two-component system nitrate/nitrite response regulator NarL
MTDPLPDAAPKDAGWRILLADDHGIVRDAVAQMLERLDPTLRVESARDFGEAQALLRGGASISLLLLDYRMPGMNGAASIEEIRTQFPKVQVGVISGSLSPEEVEPLIKAGAVGVFPKTMSGPALLMALKLAMSGQTYVPWSGDLQESARTPAPASIPPQEPAPDLTERQHEVLRLVVAGATNKEIAQRLALSEVTIKIHVAALCRKFAVSNRTQLATAAMRAGLGSPV